MLYLTTGANGAGKTLFTLRDVRAKQIKEGRPVAYNGRFDMKADFGWKKIEFKDWQDEPDGTIFFIDECHNDMPVRSGGTVPEAIRMLGEHRKRGFDFYLITQHPLNIDTFVRRLIGPPGWHRHIKRMGGAAAMSSILTWSGVKENCDKEGVGASAQIETAAFPKEVYEWYNSAMLHTGKRRIPRQIYVIAACVLLVPAIGYYAVTKFMGNLKKDGVQTDGAAVLSKLTGKESAPPAARPSSVSSAAEYMASYRPRVPGLMYSAPVYDALTSPKRVPYPAACISMASKGCKCFTQDATPYPVDEALCRTLVKAGAFYAFHEVAQVPPKEPQAAQTPTSVSQVGYASFEAPAARQVTPLPPPAPIAPLEPMRVGSFKR